MVLANLGNVSPPLFNLITLITYLFSLLLCACLACPCACLCLPTVAHTSTLPGVLAYQHTWFCLFWISFRSFVPSHQSFFVFFYLIFFTPPPPFVGHSSLFLPLNSSRLASASFPSLPVCSLCCLCCSVAVRVSWTEGESVWAGKPHTIPQHHTRTQTIKHVCGGFPPDKDRKPRERLFFMFDKPTTRVR